MKKYLFLLGVSITTIAFSQSKEENVIRGKLIKNMEHAYAKFERLEKQSQNYGQVPPNKYYEQDYVRTMNPETGVVETGKLQKVWKEVLEGKYNPKSTMSLFPDEQISTSDYTINNTLWTERGPYSVGGRTRAIAFDPADESGKRVFAGGVSGGLWVNNDITENSSEWKPIGQFWENTSISSIAFDPNDSNKIYVGTGESCTHDATGSGIWRSVDGGTTWENIFTVPQTYSYNGLIRNGNFYVNDVKVRNNNGTSEVYAGVSGGYNEGHHGHYNAGLYKSTDGGNTFNKIQSLTAEGSSSVGYSIQQIEIAADNSVWVSTRRSVFSDIKSGGKVFKSTDTNGVNFVNVYDASLPNSRVNFTLSVTNPNKAYVLMQGDGASEPVRILKTTDGGQSWLSTSDVDNVIALPEDPDPGIAANDFTRGQHFYDLIIRVDPENDDIVYTGGINVHKSEDGAKTWKTITKWHEYKPGNIVVIHADQHAIVFNPKNKNQILFGNDGGIYFAKDKNEIVGTTGINMRNTRYNVTQFYDAALNPVMTPQNEEILAGAQDNGTQVLYGAPLANDFYKSFEYYGGDGGMVAFDDDNDYVINSYIYNNHIIYSYTASKSENLIAPSEAYSTGHFINEIALDKNLDIFYSYRDGLTLFKVTGLNTNTLDLDQSVITVGTPNNRESVSKIVVSPYTTTSSTLFVGSTQGRLFKVTGAQTDNSVSTEIQAPFEGSISDIEFGATENDIIVTVSNYGENIEKVYYTTDGGQNWMNKHSNLPDMPIRCSFMNPENNNEVLLGTELGVWGTTNFLSDNPTWSQYTNGIGNVKITNIDYRPSTKTVLASTYGRGVFTSTNEEVMSTNNQSNVLVNAERVYPNPSRGILHLHYDEEKYSNVDITIYDMSGQKLYSKESLKSDEEFSVNLTKGVYLLEAKSNGKKFFTSNVLIK